MTVAIGRYHRLGAVEVGDRDPMSQARADAKAIACRSESPTGRICTRACGHDEVDHDHGHPAHRHVHVGPDDTVWEVWS